MAIFFKVFLVAFLARRIKPACIPVTAFTGSLWPKVYPYTELRVPEPGRFAGIVLLDRFPGRLERPGGYRDIQLHFRKRFQVAHRYAVDRLLCRNGRYRR